MWRRAIVSEHVGPNSPSQPSGGQAQINPTAALTFPRIPFNSTEEMAIDRKSRKPLENKLPLKCSKVNFYFKGVCF